MTPEDGKARERLRLMYGFSARQDDDGTWWVESDLRPELLNVATLSDAVRYFDSLPQSMIDSFGRSRGFDSER